MTRILVAYASKMGSNAEIAEAIAGVLRDAGLEAEALPAKELRDLTPYDAVVLGSALYAAHWQRDANRFVARNREALRERPLWLWSSGPLDRALAVVNMPLTPNATETIGDLPYRAHHTFGGRLDPEAPGVDAQIVATHQVGDFRPWAAILEYAAKIARELASDLADPA